MTPKSWSRLLLGSVRRQLTLSVAVVVTVMMTVLVWDLTARQEQSMRSQQVEQALALARSVAVSSSVWVASRDYAGLQEIIQGLDLYPDLTYAIVLDRSGRILAHSDTARRGQYLDDLPRDAQARVLLANIRAVDVASPVLLGDAHIGWVRLGLGNRHLSDDVVALRRNATMYGLTAILIATLFAVLTAGYLTRGLNAVRKVADAVDKGNTSLRLPVNGSDETAELARRFNSMLDTLASRERTLAEGGKLFEAVFENAAVGIAKVALDGRFVLINRAFCDILGYTRDEVLTPGFGFQKITFEEDLQPDLERVAQLLRGDDDRYTMEKRYVRKDGAIVWVDLWVYLVRSNDGVPLYFISAVQDIGGRKQTELALQLAASVFTHAREGIVIADRNGDILDVNTTFTQITGYTAEEVKGANPRILKSGQQDAAFYRTMYSELNEHGFWSGELWNRRKNGELYAVLQTISAVRDATGALTQYVALFSDITTLKMQQAQMEHIAHFDALTGLANRILLTDRLQQAMALATRRGQQLAVVYIDLDGFKTINDKFGHETGDELLIALARRMLEALRDGDTLARIGGDEFVAVLVDLPDVTTCLPVMQRLLHEANQPVSIKGLQLQVSASQGVTFYPQQGDITADQLLRQADHAMYQAKVAGKNRYHLFDAERDSVLRYQYESVERLHEALLRGELVLYYQPKINMRSGKVIGAEALIRWSHPERGLLPPAEFLPAIENHALAVQVGEWVIEQALTRCEAWHAAGMDIGVSVNVGALQLQQPDFVQRLTTILSRHAPRCASALELEVLETSAVHDFAQISQVISACAALGVRFALDDFGTGYSSLTYLRRLRVQTLKIDQSFVRGMLEDPEDMAILRGIISLASAFKRDVVAEGVETAAHGTQLLQLGCELAQGYGIARPMPAQTFLTWAGSWTPPHEWDELPWLGGLGTHDDAG